MSMDDAIFEQSLNRTLVTSLIDIFGCLGIYDLCSIFDIETWDFKKYFSSKLGSNLWNYPEKFLKYLIYYNIHPKCLIVDEQAVWIDSSVGTDMIDFHSEPNERDKNVIQKIDVSPYLPEDTRTSQKDDIIETPPQEVSTPEELPTSEPPVSSPPVKETSPSLREMIKTVKRNDHLQSLKEIDDLSSSDDEEDKTEDTSPSVGSYRVVSPAQLSAMDAKMTSVIAQVKSLEEIIRKSELHVKDTDSLNRTLLHHYTTKELMDEISRRLPHGAYIMIPMQPK